MGEKNEKDAEAFEKEVALAQKKYESDASRLEALGPLRAAAAGLKKRIDKLESVRAALADQHKAALLAYFKDGVAEQAGAVVKEHGAIVRDSIAEVVACGSIIFALGVPNNIGSGYK